MLGRLLLIFESKIVLIDREQLAQFMFEHNDRVAPASTYEVKKIDADFRGGLSTPLW
jgi:restriction endonuclease Mrr